MSTRNANVESIKRLRLQKLMIGKVLSWIGERDCQFPSHHQKEFPNKIIKYERIILYLHHIFQSETLSQYAFDGLKKSSIRRQKVEQEKLVNYLKDVDQLELEVKNREGFHVQDQKTLQALDQIKRACKGMISAEKIIDFEKAANSQRYFKRASNQLIKTLKRL